ncbi:hypothetical protein Cma02nite_28260 [Cellulomonas marina]|uniref:DNA mismatch endonuclease, patch repair protein n=2 Tax=Cellulomonas marina TaxID=988821 RepID=A0A1I1AFJ2_9CELL|nr:hypothetical protein Cma02nite_28260 [Cellulomonas marina]SFB36789.1 DNA mismatch endonuclease, patch repair protein [Cellulomonas marina]
MASVPRKDNPRERALRSALHARGLRFRVGHKVPGLPRRTMDVAFTRARVAVFLDGCFWHGCPDHGTQPQANGAWWSEKLATNMARDADTDAHLKDLGWEVVRIWEHVPLEEAVDVVANAVASRRIAQGRRDAERSDTPSPRSEPGSGG